MSSKRKQKAFAYLSQEKLFGGAQPKKCMTYTSFREQQNEAPENGCWNFPYTFEHPSGLQIVNGQLPPNCNKLDVDVTSGSLEDVTEKDLGLNQDEEQAALPKREKWIISKVEDGRLNYIHVSQAIWLLLPREYIARCRQKRHWASKYLPGKEPLNPDHDIFGYVALKRITEGVKTHMVSRVQIIKSTKEGTEVLSSKLKESQPTGEIKVFTLWLWHQRAI